MVGHPVAQTHTPALINRWCQDNDHDVIMIGASIEPQTIDSFFDTLRGWGNCIGCTVTMPYKQTAFAACDVLTDRANRLGCVNTIRRLSDGTLCGEMTDGVAMTGALRKNNIDIGGKSVLLAGAGGGAGSAIADALCSGGIARLILIEPNLTRRRAVGTMLRQHHPAVTLDLPESSLVTADIAINATPLGMDESDPLPFALDVLPAGAIVADAVTTPVHTKLLRQAADRGFLTQSGGEMAAAQLEFQRAYWGLS